MKIVKKEDFLKLPIGTLYSEYEPDMIHGLFIKQESVEGSRGHFIDYFFIDLVACVPSQGADSRIVFLTEKLSTGESFDVIYEGKRDGVFDDDQLYLIYEEKDVRDLLAQVLHVKYL